jgi:hypothetical protein
VHSPCYGAREKVEICRRPQDSARDRRQRCWYTNSVSRQRQRQAARNVSPRARGVVLVWWSGLGGTEGVPEGRSEWRYRNPFWARVHSTSQLPEHAAASKDGRRWRVGCDGDGTARPAGVQKKSLWDGDQRVCSAALENYAGKAVAGVAAAKEKFKFTRRLGACCRLTGYVGREIQGRACIVELGVVEYCNWKTQAI